MMYSTEASSLHPGLRFFVLFLLSSMLSACGGGGGNSNNPSPSPPPPPAPSLTALSLTAQSMTITLGLTEQLTVVGTFSDGSTKNVSTGLSWSSSATTVATVSSTGVVNTLGQGTVTISATSGSTTANINLKVGPPVLTGLAITPGNLTLDISSQTQAQFTATGMYTDKSTLDLTAVVTWSAVNPYIASINAGGALTAYKPGHTSIGASTSNISASAELTVQGPPRFFYVTSLTGRVITRAAVDHSSGQLRYESYLPNLLARGVFECLTIDPSQHYAYLASTVPNPGTGGSPGIVSIFSIDPTSGALTSLGLPTNVPTPLGCIQFEPSGRFGYSVSGVNNATNPIVIFSRNATDGTLSVLGTVPLSGSGNGGIVIDPLGQYLYLSAIYSGSGTQALAYGFAIDNTTGALTPVPGTPFPLSNVTGQFAIDQTGRFLYMSNTNGASIDGYAIDRGTGKLSAVPGMSLATCVNPTPLEFAPSNRYAYAGCFVGGQAGSVESFAVSSTGQLSQIGSAPAGTTPQQLLLDPAGGSLYATGFSNYIYTYQIGTDGIAHAGRTLGAQSETNSMAMVGGAAPVTYNTQYAYVSSAGDSKLTTYSVASDGSLRPTTSLNTQPSALLLSGQPWSSDFLLGSGSVRQPNITPYNITNGTPTSAVAFGNTSTVGGLATDISDQWAFVSDPVNQVLYTYQKFGDGTSWGLITYADPGQTPFTTFAAGAGAGPLAVDPAGRLLYVGNQTANTISAFQYFGSSPELNVVTGSPYSLAAKPIALTLDATGLFLYVATADKQLSVYAVNYFSGGALTLLGANTLAGTPSAIAVEPTGRYIYVADSTGISAFAVNSGTGALTAIGSSPTIALSNCNGVWVEPSGKYLYASTSLSSSGAIYGYQINADGSLTGFASNPAATSNGAVAITFKASIQ